MAVKALAPSSHHLVDGRGRHHLAALAEVAIAQPERTSTGMVRVIRTEIAASAEQLRSRNDSPVPAMLNVQRVPVGAVTKHPGVNNVFKMTMP